MTAARGNSEHRRRRLIAGGLLGLLLALPLLDSALFDDAYIHARIAANLIEHGEFAYTQGDRFKASSSTGYVLMMALVMHLASAEMALRTIAAATIVATTLGLSQLIGNRRQHRWTVALAGAAMLPFLLVASYGGMETPIACALMVWAAVALQRKRDDAAILLIAVSTWFRFEMFFLLAAITVQACLQSRSLRPTTNLLPAVVLVAVELFLFGSIVPHAALVKPIVYAVPGDLSMLAALMLGTAPMGFVGSSALILSAIAELATRPLIRAVTSRHLPFLIFPLALLGAWALGRTLVFDWYFCLLGCSFGLAVVLRDADSGQRTADSGQRTADSGQRTADSGQRTAR